MPSPPVCFSEGENLDDPVHEGQDAIRCYLEPLPEDGHAANERADRRSEERPIPGPVTVSYGSRSARIECLVPPRGSQAPPLARPPSAGPR